jgi:hypothetical protein
VTRAQLLTLVMKHHIGGGNRSLHLIGTVTNNDMQTSRRELACTIQHV